jgi:Holliday junction resolvasome RuvABC DNA-binding subunit
MTADEAQTLAKAIEGQELAFLMYDKEAGRHDWEQLVAHMDDDWKAAVRLRVDEQAEAWKQTAKEQYQRLQDDERRLANGYKIGGRHGA